MAVLSAVAHNIAYVSYRDLENAHPMGVFQMVERAQRFLGYHRRCEIGKNAEIGVKWKNRLNSAEFVSQNH